jgi:hypothetical protein
MLPGILRLRRNEGRFVGSSSRLRIAGLTFHGMYQFLLCSQRNHGVDTHGAARREKTRAQRDTEQQTQY